MNLRISASFFIFALTGAAFASPTVIQQTTMPSTGKFYAGVFGGGGSSNNFNSSQFGTAFFTEAEGGPLSVNAFGRLNSESTAFFGAQIGYQAHDIVLNCSQLTLEPAVELEGYSMNSSTFNGTLVNNAVRLPEHDFAVAYPMSRTIFLANAVLNFSNPQFLVHPYIGFGIGDAILRISNASSVQLNPPEENINHYNTSTNDGNSTFAGQVKVGVSYDINNYVSLFADYRWVYLASTLFTFGSTVSPVHVETTSWQVKVDSQRYNLGNIGVRFNLA